MKAILTSHYQGRKAAIVNTRKYIQLFPVHRLNQRRGSPDTKQTNASLLYANQFRAEPELPVDVATQINLRQAGCFVRNEVKAHC